jgi:predicted  nucleic acid-binding Zn-ribbon protein
MGLPAGAGLSRGTDMGRGRWHVPPEEIDDLRLTLAPAAARKPFRLIAEAEVRHADGHATVATAVIEVGGDATPQRVPLPLPGLDGTGPYRLAGLPATLVPGLGQADPSGDWLVPEDLAAGLFLLVSSRVPMPFEIAVRREGGSACRLGVEIPAPPRAMPPPPSLRARLVPIGQRRPTRLEAAPRGGGAAPEPQDLPAALAEIERLKAAIGTLRDELEKVREGTREAEEAATAAARAEVAGLRDQAQALRDRLEALRDARPLEIQAAVDEAAERIAALKADAQARRDRLEEIRGRREEDVEKATVAAKDDLTGFLARAHELRDAVDAEVAAYKAEQEALTAETATRVAELHRAIAAIRDKVDAARA